MFQGADRPSAGRSFFMTLGILFHATVYDIRKAHRNAFVGLLIEILQSMIMILTFFLMYVLLDFTVSAIHGDFLMFLMSGIMLFMLHAKTITAVVKADGHSSAMMQHAPLTTFVSIGAAALSVLYLQLLSILVILILYHVLWMPLEIEDPVGAMSMILLSWMSGLGIGLLFFSLRPWAPDVVGIGASIYSRLDMIFSGKMFVANTLPGYMLAVFYWNPLFHTIDQFRGYIFINYTPHFSSPTYALWVSLALIMAGLMIESQTRRYASISWSAGR